MPRSKNLEAGWTPQFHQGSIPGGLVVPSPHPPDLPAQRHGGLVCRSRPWRGRLAVVLPSHPSRGFPKSGNNYSYIYTCHMPGTLLLGIFKPCEDGYSF